MENPDTLDELRNITARLARLRQQIVSQRRQIEHLETAYSAKSQRNQARAETDPAMLSVTTTSRRHLLHKLAVGLALGGVAAVTATVATPAAQASGGATFTNRPSGIGAVFVRPGTTVTGTPPGGKTYGTVASAGTNLDLSGLPNTNASIAALSDNNAGVYVKTVPTSNNEAGITILGLSDTGYGAYGESQTGVGIYTSNQTGGGVLAQSLYYAPLKIVPSSVPTTGTRQLGDIYMSDSDNHLHLWDGAVWRKLLYEGE